MKNQNAKARRTAVIFPKNQKILNTLGENITLAMKRRGITRYDAQQNWHI